MSNGIPITADNFDAEVLHSPIPVLLDFWASWCAPCKMIAPFIDQLADEYAGRVKIGKVNIEEQEELATQHSIVSVPTLVMYQNGAIAAQRVGAAPKHDIEALFKNMV